jgi:hypothetical protein
MATAESRPPSTSSSNNGNRASIVVVASTALSVLVAGIAVYTGVSNAVGPVSQTLDHMKETNAQQHANMRNARADAEALNRGDRVRIELEVKDALARHVDTGHQNAQQELAAIRISFQEVETQFRSLRELMDTKFHFQAMHNDEDRRAQLTVFDRLRRLEDGITDLRAHLTIQVQGRPQ